jgi:hypothetical protein
MQVMADFEESHIVHVSYTIFIHDTSMYIHITYINAHIHQGFNPTSWRCTKVFTTKPLQDFDKILKKSLNFDIKLFKKFKF